MIFHSYVKLPEGISMVSYGIPSYPPQQILINRPQQVRTAKQIGCSWEISLTSKAQGPSFQPQLGGCEMALVSDGLFNEHI